MGRKPYKSRVAAQPVVEKPIIKEEPEFLYKVQVTHPSLRIRSGPSLQNGQIGLITNQGIYEVLEEKNGWGKINSGWIMLQYTQKI